MSLCPGSTTETGSCEYDLSSLSPVAAITGYENLPPNDQEAVMSHLANVTTSWYMWHPSCEEVAGGASVHLRRCQQLQGLQWRRVHRQVKNEDLIIKEKTLVLLVESVFTFKTHCLKL